MLNASGIIVWVPDGTGATLRPALVHGYPAAALARLGALACDGDNATAAAFRDVRMHVVPAGDSGEHGALAAPLAAPEGCGGVMSLELNDGWESSESVQSTTAIIAAQLATLVARRPGEPSHRARPGLTAVPGSGGSRGAAGVRRGAGPVKSGILVATVEGAARPPRSSASSAARDIATAVAHDGDGERRARVEAGEPAAKRSEVTHGLPVDRRDDVAGLQASGRGDGVVLPRG